MIRPEVVMIRFMRLAGFMAALLAAGCDGAPNTPLNQAAVRNDVAAIRQLLAEGEKVDGDGKSWTPLIWAARSGSIDAMKVLLDSGADLNKQGSSGDNWDA